MVVSYDTDFLYQPWLSFGAGHDNHRIKPFTLNLIWLRPLFRQKDLYDIEKTINKNYPSSMCGSQGMNEST